jgi:AAA ATPase-like protein
MQRFNPFRPGSIVTPGMFSGRYDELVSMEQALFQTKNGNPQHLLIHGERGIGKSSLLYCHQLTASGSIDSFDSQKFRFITVSLELEPSNTYLDIIEKIGGELRREIAKREPAAELAIATWEFLKKWEVMGVKYADHDRPTKPSEMLDELTFTVEQTLARLGSAVDGILVFIDEADKPPSAANLGEFVKIFTERLSKRGCNRVALCIAGISTVLDRLRESHESSIRIFQILTLEPLLPPERIAVVEKGLLEAHKKNGYDVSITAEAKEAISELSEGYPHFLQQFAYCAFNEDTDNTIDIADVNSGALHDERGAIQQLGQKYFQELYFEQIGSDEYRRVLRAMAENMDGWTSKAAIRKAIQITELTLNNAIRALKNKHIIIPKPGAAGVYRLPTKSFAVWIKAFTKARDEGISSHGSKPAGPPVDTRGPNGK